MHEQDSQSNLGDIAVSGHESFNQAATEAPDCGGTPQPGPKSGEEENPDRAVSALISGAPPSNTAPANCILTPNTPPSPSFQLLRFGIDSLYLSYPGTLSHEWERDLENLKGIAQSDDPGERATAQVEIGGHLFEVKDKGKGRFPYVLG
jgi:hypothetical protein